MMRRLTMALLVALLGSAAPLAFPGTQKANVSEKISYARDIRPILANNCFVCHGPSGQAKAGLRLDSHDAATKKLRSGARAIVPGDPKHSELIDRIFAAEKERMPPLGSHKSLKESEKQLLKRWIEQGAEYQQHWALTAPQRPALPSVQQKTWPRNGIDHFILARLEHEHLQPSAQADALTLLRRVSLDLTGLPPSPAEVDTFLADKSPNAYENAVDRLLASPHYGERMAMQWLDLARYADTNGYQVDSERTMWPWREWVIHAFNDNLPFDRFTIEQLAGDLLPKATLDQKLATGFNRNHRVNEEGGSIPEEFRVEYVVDRVETTSTVWLGLTLGCARCHDHKFDAISQKEFYRFFAYFNNVPEGGVSGGNAAPVLRVPTRSQREKLKEIASYIQALEEQLQKPSPKMAAAQTQWEQQVAAQTGVRWTMPELVRVEAKNGTVLKKLADDSLLATGPNPDTDTYTLIARVPLPTITALQIEALPDTSMPAQGPGRATNGNAVLTRVSLAVTAPGVAAKAVKLTSASADFSQKDYPVTHALLGKPRNGWALYPEFGKPHQAVFQTAQPVTVGKDGLLAVQLEFAWGQQHQFGRLRLAFTDAANPHGKSGLPPHVQHILLTPAVKRTVDQQAALRLYYRTQISPESKKIAAELVALRNEQAKLEKTLPAVMVMQEMPTPRPAFVLKRGLYNLPGEKVTAGTPALLPPLPTDAPPNRLGLARWIVDPANPLTARVAVNRFWQMYFGTGIVRTAENFGIQADWPSHPELLDWLASEFVAQKWDVKKLQKLIVTSAAYRQSSKVTPALVERDPDNRLLARGPRLRLTAELIRDQALAASGLLVRKLGGPSVKPYQPAGLWEELAYGPGVNIYRQDKGENLYRRSMYTFWRRTVPPPAMTTFDAPSREVCIVQRSRTNTPLQALALLNDTIHVEASRNLAQRAMVEGGPTMEGRLTYAFRLVLVRPPLPVELKILRASFERHRQDFQAKKDEALKLLAVGESPRRQELDSAELAAYTLVAGVILNLDETITKK